MSLTSAIPFFFFNLDCHIHRNKVRIWLKSVSLHHGFLELYYTVSNLAFPSKSGLRWCFHVPYTNSRQVGTQLEITCLLENSIFLEEYCISSWLCAHLFMGCWSKKKKKNYSNRVCLYEIKDRLSHMIPSGYRFYSFQLYSPICNDNGKYVTGNVCYFIVSGNSSLLLIQIILSRSVLL